MCSIPNTANAQIALGDVNISGNIGFRYQYYNFNADPTAPVFARFPKDYYRFVFNGNVNYKSLNIPIVLSLANPTPSPLILAPKEQNFVQFIQNPGNIIRLSPTIKGVKLFIGSHTPNYSKLSAGNLQIFGLGARYQRNELTFQLNFGTTQSSIVGLVYKQRMIASRVKKNFGNGDIGINIVAVNDLENSIEATPFFFLNPKKAAMISVDGSYRINATMTVEGELASSSSTNNKLLDSVKNEFSPIVFLLPSKSGSVSGLATNIALHYKPQKHYGAKLIVRRIGENFVPVGHPFQQTDLLDVLIAPYGRFLNNKLILKGDLGRRSRNLSGRTSGQRSSQLLFNANAVYMYNKALDVQFNFMNYGIRTNVVNDTARIRIIARSVMLQPMYRFKKYGLNHTLSLQVSLDSYDDVTPVTDTLNDVNSSRIRMQYGTKWGKHEGQIAIGRYGSTSSLSTNVINSVRLSLRTKALSDNLMPRLALVVAGSNNSSLSTGKRMYFELGATYKYARKLSADLSLTNNAFNYGQLANLSMNELILRLNLNYYL